MKYFNVTAHSCKTYSFTFSICKQFRSLVKETPWINVFITLQVLAIQDRQTPQYLQSQTFRDFTPPDVFVCGIQEKHANSWEAAVLTAVQPYHPRLVSQMKLPHAEKHMHAHAHTQCSVSDFQGSFLEHRSKSKMFQYFHNVSHKTKGMVMLCISLNFTGNAIMYNISAVGFQMHLLLFCFRN